MTAPWRLGRLATAAALLLSCGDSTGGDSTPEGSTGTLTGSTSTSTPTATEPTLTSSSSTTGTGETSSESTDSPRTSTDDGPSDSSSDSTGSRTTETGSESTDGGSSSGEDTGNPTLEPWDGCAFTESFDELADGSPWPAPWVATGGVALADVQGGRGRLVPVLGDYSLARMFAPLTCAELDATFTFELTDGQTQGVGLYLRHNDGYLDHTMPPGLGYVAFSQAILFSQGIAIYRELDGIETPLTPTTEVEVLPGVVYAVRYRITQVEAGATRLQARLWPDAELEPASWHVDIVDETPELQGFAGGLAIDAWSELTMGMAADLFVDDIVVTQFPP